MIQKQNEHLSLICDISELANLVSNSKDINTFLQQVVQLVAANLNADVGSIYLYDNRMDELVLTATIGLSPDAVGQIRMRSDEGLVGHTLARMAPICEGNATKNPRYKYFESAGEDRFNSFLSVPISLGNEKIGVLVVQHELNDYFNQNDIMALRAIASQLASTVANVRLMMASAPSTARGEQRPPINDLRIVRAEATVSGFALAPSAILHPFDPLGENVHDEAYKTSLADFELALQKTTQQLKKLQEQLVQRLPESTALIFEAHHMILKDPRFNEEIKTHIREGVPASTAIKKIAHYFIRLVSKQPQSLS